jgi:hypothetical protein
MTVQPKPLAEVTRQAIELLARELGAADTARFINQFSTGHGGYTSERETQFGQKSLEEIAAEIKAGTPDSNGT